MSVRSILIATAIAMACAASVGCASQPASPPTTAATKKQTVKPPGVAAIGDRTYCPVTGEEFTVTAQSPKAQVGGKTYYFCCGKCVPTFQANPGRYIRSST